MNPPSNIQDIYKQQGWNDQASIDADIASGGWKSKVGSSGGSGGVDFSFPDIKLDDVGGSALDFAEKAEAPIDSAFGDYQKTADAMPSPLSIYGKLEQEAGIPELRKTAGTLSGQINDLEDTVRRTEKDVSLRSNNSLMTEAQRRRQVSEIKNPLLENLGWLGQSLGRILEGIRLGTQDIGTKVGLEVQGQDRTLGVLKEKVGMLTDRASRMMTGFTTDREAKLNILLKKIESQERISLAEYQEANDLAREERQTKLAKEELDNATDIVDAGSQKLLINKQTGEIIARFNDISGGGTGNSTFTPTSPKPTFKPTVIPGMSANSSNQNAGNFSANLNFPSGSFLPTYFTPDQ